MKKFILSLSIVFIFLIGFSQGEIVNIPDTNFKAYLVGNATINTNNDTEISIAEAEATDIMNCYNKSISDLTGINYFVNLTRLDCESNLLTSLDVTGLTSLNTLICNNNKLIELNVSGLSKLTSLHCGENNLSKLNISILDKLQYLICDQNRLTSLIVKSENLVSLTCFQNQLIKLDISRSTKLNSLYCHINQLKTICISESIDTNALYAIKDASAKLSTTCSPVGLEEEVAEKGLTILKAYNLQGQEVPKNTTGEVIILLYDNGIREKTYVAE